VKQLAAVPLIRRTVLSVAVPDGRNQTGAIDRELNFLVSIRQNISLCVYRLDRHKREILSISVNNCSIWRQAKTDWTTGGRKNALSYFSASADAHSL